MTPTLRRLNDRERYWGLTWPGWVAAGGAGGVLYGAVRISPLGTRATITVVVLAIALGAMVIAGVSGQALSPGRHLLAIIRYRRCAKHYTLAGAPDKRGLVLDTAPELPAHLELPQEPLDADLPIDITGPEEVR